MFFIDNIDIKILKFINKYEVVPKHKIFKEFPEDKFDTSFRLENLKEVDSAQFSDISIYGVPYICKLYKEHISALGKTSYIETEFYYLSSLSKKIIKESRPNILIQTKNFILNLFEKLKNK